MAILAPAYLPRRPTETVLYGIVRQNLESFLAFAARGHATLARPAGRATRAG
jgi:hypothetical protein